MPQINQIALNNFIQDDTEMLGDLASIFAQALGDSTARLNLAVDNRDASVLRETAHQLKSRLGYFSAAGLRELAQLVEMKGKQNQLNDVRPIVAELLAGIDEMMDELRELTGMPLAYATDE